MLEEEPQTDIGLLYMKVCIGIVLCMASIVHCTIISILFVLLYRKAPKVMYHLELRSVQISTLRLTMECKYTGVY